MAKNHWCSVDTYFQNTAGRVWHSLLHINVAYTSFMNVCIQLPFRLPQLQDHKSLTLCWLSFSGWGRERISLGFDYEGGQYIHQRQWRTKVNVLRFAEGYLNVTVNKNTRKPKPEIGTDGSSQPLHNPQVDRYGCGSGPPRNGGSGSWTGQDPNPTVFVFWNLTAGRLLRPVPNTTHNNHNSTENCIASSVSWIRVDDIDHTIYSISATTVLVVCILHPLLLDNIHFRDLILWQ